jgi:hypothetical protein
MAAMRLAKFTIDPYGDAEFEGFTADEHWNGWACPYFTREQAMRIVEAHNRIGGGHARYDEATDSFLFSFASPDEEDAFLAVNIGGRTLYPVGAFCWIWEESAKELTSV